MAWHLGRSVNILGNLRLVLRVLAITAAVAPCLVMHGIWGMLRIPSPWPRFFLAITTRICGIWLRTTGERLRADVFYVANHVGWIDIPIIAGLTGCAFVAQEPIARWPIIGWLAKRNYTVFVSRTNRLGIGGQIETLRAAIQERTPITIFPEGTTTNGRSLLPFKPGLFAVMVPPPKPMMVQPVVLIFDKIGNDLAWIGQESAPSNALRVLRNHHPIRVTAQFLQPYDPAPYPDRKAIAAEARRQILAALQTSLATPLAL